MQDESGLGRFYDEHAQALFAFLLNFTQEPQSSLTAENAKNAKNGNGTE